MHRAFRRHPVLASAPHALFARLPLLVHTAHLGRAQPGRAKVSAVPHAASARRNCARNRRNLRRILSERFARP